MKKMVSRMTWLFVVMIFFATACKTTVMVKGGNSKPLPPGQAKKVTGSQSAKQYAPGQQKKK